MPELERRLQDDETPVEIKRELPAVLVRIGTPLAQQVLIEGLLQADVTLRYRVVASLNKLQDVHPDLRVDREVVELLIAAEIAGHYRSYQVLGPLRARLREDDPVLQALHRSMEQELERIFRLMALLFRGSALHDAYVGLRSTNSAMRANALEFLDNVLEAGSPAGARAAARQPGQRRRTDRDRGPAGRRAGRDRGRGRGDAAGERRCVAAIVRGVRRRRAAAARPRRGSAPLQGRVGSGAAQRRPDSAGAALGGEADPAQHRPVPAEVGMGVG